MQSLQQRTFLRKFHMTKILPNCWLQMLVNAPHRCMERPCGGESSSLPAWIFCYGLTGVLNRKAAQLRLVLVGLVGGTAIRSAAD